MQAGVVAALVTSLSFFLIHLAPGDPFATLLTNPDVDLGSNAETQTLRQSVQHPNARIILASPPLLDIVFMTFCICR